MQVKLAALILCAPLSSAFAGEGPLLKVSRSSGFVPPEWAYSARCEVSGEHTLRSAQRAGRDAETEYKETVYTSALPNEEAVRAGIQRALRARIQKQVGPVDGPSDTYTGIVSGDVADQHVRLLGRSTSGHDYRNTARSVSALVEFADLNCPRPTRD